MTKFPSLLSTDNLKTLLTKRSIIVIATILLLAVPSLAQSDRHSCNSTIGKTVMADKKPKMNSYSV